jgi:hypothetical protein
MEREGSATNRNVSTNDLYHNSSKKRRINDLWNDVEGCSTEELKRLKKELEKTNKYFTDAEIDDLKLLLATKMDETITIAKQKPMAIDYNLLFQQMNTKNQQGHLFHNFTRKEKTYEKLYEWPMFCNTIEPFFKPIHFRIFKKASGNLASSSSPQQQHINDEVMTISNKTQLQNILIFSHFKTLNKITCQTIIGSLECELQCLLTEAVILGDTVCFLFEWINANPFLFIIGFRIDFKLKEEEKTDESVKRTLKTFESQYYKLNREDILGEDSTKSKDSTKKPVFNIRWLRRAIRDASLSYLYYAYAKRQ